MTNDPQSSAFRVSEPLPLQVMNTPLVISIHLLLYVCSSHVMCSAGAVSRSNTHSMVPVMIAARVPGQFDFQIVDKLVLDCFAS